jgi:hypothetical protein
MRFKYKIPPFVFGVSIGLLAGIAFFIFKIDDYLKKFNKPDIDNIKIVEQTISSSTENKDSKVKVILSRIKNLVSTLRTLLTSITVRLMPY